MKKNVSSVITFYGKSRRAMGEVPELGKVARIGNPQSSSSRNRSYLKSLNQASMNEKKRNLLLIRWGTVAIIVATGLILVLTLKMTKTQSEESVVQTPQITVESTESTAKDDNTPAPEILENKAKAFLNSANEQELLGHIRASEIPQAEVFPAFHAALEKEGTIKKVSYMGPVDSTMVRAESVIVKYENRHNRMIIFTPTTGGDWKIDLAAFIRYNSLPLETLLDGGEHEGIFRLFAAKDAYYNSIYVDEAKWKCFSLGSPDYGDLMLGYVDQQSPAYQLMMQALDKNRGFGTTSGGSATPVHITVKLAHRKGAEARQMEIVDVLSDEWTIPEKPLEEPKPVQ